ncbi:MAG: hypothetical protein WA693_24475 [Pseudolabrys sp.]
MRRLTPIVVNFAHLFSMSLLPLSTAWMAISKLAPEPVAFYAAVFFLVNATYICLIRELVELTHDVTAQVRKILWIRSITTLCLFGLAAVIALKYPLVGLEFVFVVWLSISGPIRVERKRKNLARPRGR